MWLQNHILRYRCFTNFIVFKINAGAKASAFIFLEKIATALFLGKLSLDNLHCTAIWTALFSLFVLSEKNRLFPSYSRAFGNRSFAKALTHDSFLHSVFRRQVPTPASGRGRPPLQSCETSLLPAQRLCHTVHIMDGQLAPLVQAVANAVWQRRTSQQDVQSFMWTMTILCAACTISWKYWKQTGCDRFHKIMKKFLKKV